MAFTGKEGGQIPLNEGANMTTNYRNQNPNEIIAHFFGRDILQKILDQDDCMGIRMYYGINDERQKELILVGVDSQGNDLIELVADISTPCPHICSKPNPLNS